MHLSRASCSSKIKILKKSSLAPGAGQAGFGCQGEGAAVRPALVCPRELELRPDGDIICSVTYLRLPV